MSKQIFGAFGKIISQEDIGNQTDTTPILPDQSLSRHYDDESIEKQAKPAVVTKQESVMERRERIRSLRILNFAGFTFALSFAIVLTGAFPYLKELMPHESEESLLKKYGIVVSTFPIAQLICSPIFGKIADVTHSIRPICLVMSVVYTGASVLYATLSDISYEPQTRFYLMILARFCIGAFSANIGPIQGYICQVTTEAERTREISILSACKTLGFVFGPPLQALFGTVGCSSLAGMKMRYFSIESYNVCGWITALLGIICFISFLPRVFVERTGAALIENKNVPEDTMPEDGKKGKIEARGEIVPTATPDYVGITICLVCLSIYYFNFVFMEAVGAPICMEQFGWTQSQTVIYFGILIGVDGILSLGCYLALNWLSSRVEERKLMISVGVFSLILGRIAMFPIPSFPLSPEIPEHTNDSANMIMETGYSPRIESMFNNMNPTNSEEMKDLGSLRTNISKEYDLKQMPFVNNALKSFRHVYHKKSFPKIAKNVACEEVSGPPGCDLEWCSYTPAINLAQFIASAALTTIGFAFSVPITLTIVSKMYGPRRQGLLMSLTVMFGAFSRFLGPFFVSYVYTNYGTYYANGSSLVPLLIALMMLCFNYNRFVPLKSESE